MTRSLHAGTLLLLTLLLGACGSTEAGTTPPGQGGGPVTQAPYTMTGVVRNAAGQPVPGAEVWADNTLHYNMNALGTTDAQGRYTVTLPRDQLGTWRAGGKFRTLYHGQWFEVALEPGSDAAFSADVGAVRDFTLRISGAAPDGHDYGGLIWPHPNASHGDFDLGKVQWTFTPDGPLLDGSEGEVLTGTLDGDGVYVPLGQYVVTARYPDGSGALRPMVMSYSDHDLNTNHSSWTVAFEKTPEYGFMAEFDVKLAP